MFLNQAVTAKRVIVGNDELEEFRGGQIALVPEAVGRDIVLFEQLLF
jgi:hypothetical protein